jgi:hypothetical protein
MAPRKPATAEEITELITEYLGSHRSHKGAIAAPLNDFLRFAQARMRTTAQNARLWIKNIAITDGAPFRIMLASYGVFTHQLADHPEPHSLRSYQFERWTALENFHFDAPPKLNAFGTPGAEGDARAEDVSFIVPAAVLNNMIIETSARSDEIKAKEVANRAAELDAIEADHGEGIGLLRGLLHAAGIPRNDSTLRIRRHVFFDGKETSTNISIDLTGAQLDALAPVLRELGINPRYRKKPGNAEPRPERLPDAVTQ